MNLTQRDRRAVRLGVVGVALIGAYFFVLEPLAVRYAKLVRDHRSAAATIRRKILDGRRYAEREPQVRNWEEKAGNLIPSRPYSEQITAVGTKIIAAAGENGVQLQGATPSAPTPWSDTAGPAMAGAGGEAPLAQALIHIDAQAEWENVFKFVAALYRIEGVLSVEQFDLSGDPRQGGQLKLKLVISVLMKAAEGGPSWAG